jgi:hypothetical protein
MGAGPASCALVELDYCSLAVPSWDTLIYKKTSTLTFCCMLGGGWARTGPPLITNPCWILCAMCYVFLPAGQGMNGNMH